MSDTAVVHLVRAANGIGAFETFLDSYSRHPAGVEHDLVLLLKGFSSERQAQAHLDLAGELVSGKVFVEDEELDLSAYATAAERLNHRRLCFLNSFSVICAPRWLELLGAAHAGVDVGIAGATGSWGSIRSYSRFMLGLHGPYHGVLGERRSTVALLNAVNAEPSDGAPPTSQRRIPFVSFAQALAEQARGFLPFPAHHLRTNGFMVDREVLLALGTGAITRKADAYRLESGRDSLTLRLERQGLEALVVGRNGVSYRRGEWPASTTFWQGAQENLLIADKQTAKYDAADQQAKEALSRYAWGSRGSATAPPVRPSA